MLLTFFRPLIADIGYLESTWPHVTEAEGVRLQLREDIEAGLMSIQDEYGTVLGDPHFIESRRIVTGNFHPGRKVLPPHAIQYEVVFDFPVPEGMDESELQTRLHYIFYEVVGMSGSFKPGNVTNRKEENVA